MATIITREVGATAKGDLLTYAEVDQNFINLNESLLTERISSGVVASGAYVPIFAQSTQPKRLQLRVSRTSGEIYLYASSSYPAIGGIVTRTDMNGSFLMHIADPTNTSIRRDVRFDISVMNRSFTIKHSYFTQNGNFFESTPDSFELSTDYAGVHFQFVGAQSAADYVLYEI